MKRIIILLALITVLAGCSNDFEKINLPQESSEQSSDSGGASESGNATAGLFDGMTITPASDVKGFTIREARDDMERFAMDFVDSLFFQDYQAIFAMTDFSSFAPAAPIVPSEEQIYWMIINHAIGYSNFNVKHDWSRFNYSSDMHNGLQGTWIPVNNSEMAGSIGIVDVTDVGIVVAHSWSGCVNGFYASGKAGRTSVERHGAALIRVPVAKDSNNELKVVRANYVPLEHGKLLDETFSYRVPHGAVVIFRGEVLSPVEEGGGIHILPDTYEITGLYHRVPEEVIIDMGSNFGIIRDYIYATNLSPNPESGSMMLLTNSQRNQPVTDFRALSITMPEFSAIAEEVDRITMHYIDSVVASMETDNFPELAALFLEGGGAHANLRNIKREFNNWVQGELENPFAGAKRQTDIAQITVLTPRTVEVTVIHKFTSPQSGTQYAAVFDFRFFKYNGEWSIQNMPQNFFSRSANFWQVVSDS